MSSTPLQELFGKAGGRRHPFHASIELTYTCNMGCYFCYNPVARPGQKRATAAATMPPGTPLTLQEIVSLLDQMKAMNILYLTITGGEPMVHPHLWEVLAEAKQRTFAVRLFTNGLMIDESAADRLAVLRPNCLEISIHGADDATAQALNRVPGSLTRLLRTLELLRDRELQVFLKCVVTRLVEDQLEEIQAIGTRFGFPVFFDPVLTVSDDGEGYPLELQATDNGIRRIFSRKGLNLGSSPFERRVGQSSCGLASSTIHIDPHGNVRPCIQWRERVGNVREKSLRDIWTGSQELERILQMTKRVNSSLSEQTEDYLFCGHCPALSQLRYGDPLRPEEQYLRMARIRREVYESEKGGNKDRSR